jgi:integrase
LKGLTWEQVDLSRKLAWIHPDQAKARKAIAVPLNDTALQVVREQRRDALRRLEAEWDLRHSSF